MHKVPRRIAAGVLIVFGAVLMFAAPDTMSGLVMVVLAVAIEAVGIALERRH